MAGVRVSGPVPTPLNPRAPFAKLYVVVKHGDKRVYKSLGSAKAQVTVEVNKSTSEFRTDVELWCLSQSGWTLELEVLRGEPHTSIPWESNVARSKRAEEEYRRETARREEEAARHEYERLKKRFG